MVQSEQSLENKMLSAEEEFRAKCYTIGVIPWIVRSQTETPYSVGVSTSWPNKVDEELRAEAQAIVDLAKDVATAYGLEPLYEGLHAAAGGALVMYVGFRKI